MLDRLKTFAMYLLTLALTIITFGAYAYRQKQKAQEQARENERLMIENQGLVQYQARLNKAHSNNQKRQLKAEQDLDEGKRDYFSSSDW